MYPPPSDTGSVLPPFQLKTRHTLTDILFDDVTILGILRSLNPNKSSGWYSISPRMLKICDSSIVKPIMFILETCLKLSNVCPIDRKKSKNDFTFFPRFINRVSLEVKCLRY